MIQPSSVEPVGRVLMISQVFVPDPASVGQHMADAAACLGARGHEVLVLTSSRGYDDPRRKFARREVVNGVAVRRLPLSSFGKSSLLMRLVAQSLFLAQSIVRGLFAGRLDAVVITTSPPLAPLAGLILGKLKRAPVTFWVMDLNPDQAIAAGAVRETSIWARSLDWAVRSAIRRAARIVVPDRFMAERVKAKAAVGDRLTVLPPWPHDDHLDPVDHEDNSFRREHGLEGKFVVMYSGNHSPSHPLTTVLEAGLRLRESRELSFLFIGGGNGKREVESVIRTNRPPNIESLPYQPLDTLKYSLSAADLHVVSMGNSMVGRVHPCKVYGAMAVGRPVLLLGPAESHLTDLVDAHDLGWRVDHGDVEGAVAAIQHAMQMPAEKARAMGERGREAIAHSLSKDALCGQWAELVESTFR